MDNRKPMADLNDAQKAVVSWFRVVLGADSLGVYGTTLTVKRSYEYGRFEHIWLLKTTKQTLKALVDKGYLEVVPDWAGQAEWTAYRLSLKGLAFPYDEKHPALLEFQQKMKEWRK